MASRMSFQPGRFVASASRLNLFTSSSLASRSGRFYSSQPPKPRRNDEVKFWPFVVVILVGTGGYVALVNRRNGKPGFCVHSPYLLLKDSATIVPFLRLKFHLLKLVLRCDAAHIFIDCEDITNCLIGRIHNPDPHKKFTSSF